MEEGGLGENRSSGVGSVAEFIATDWAPQTDVSVCQYVAAWQLD